VIVEERYERVSLRTLPGYVGCIHGVSIRSCQARWEDSVERQAFKSLAIFVGVLIVMKFFFGWNISIVGSVVLTIVLSLVMNAANRR
jgi:hypothetical protein